MLSEFLYLEPTNLLVKVSEEVDSECVLFVKFISICILHSLESLGGSSVLQKDVSEEDIRRTINIYQMKKLKRHWTEPLPLGRTISLRVEFCCDFAKLGEDLMDDIFQFFQSLRANLRDVIYHHHRVDAISLLRLLLQDILQELCAENRKGEMLKPTYNPQL